MSDPVPLENAGTSEVTGDLLCLNCGYIGDIRTTYKPTTRAFSDIECPKCRSTNNQHNQIYTSRLFSGR